MVILPLNLILVVSNNGIATTAHRAISPIDVVVRYQAPGTIPAGECGCFDSLDCFAAPPTSELHKLHVVDRVRLLSPRHAPPFQSRDAVRIDFDN
jgi:hypothetical protein